MKVTRRTFLKGSAAGAGTLLVSHLAEGELETLAVTNSQAPAGPVEDYVPTTCWIGKQDCGILARRIDGRVISLAGDGNNPRNVGRLCPKGIAQITTLYDANRITTPLIRKNEKGIPGTWREASWDEALTLVADRFQKALEKDRRLTGYVPGRTKVGTVYDDAFRQATGIAASYGRRGNDSGGAGEDAILATWGVRTPIAPDLEHCKYLICYWNLTQAGGPGLCQITYPRQVADAKARGMKVVAINPYARSVGHFADEWLPIRPGTDLAFWLAVIHGLIEGGYLDREFLKAHTNAASLVKSDGTLLRRGGEELVWDTRRATAVPYGTGVDPALAGQFDVAGVRVKPALQMLRDQVEQRTPEWAAGITGLPVAQIRRITQEMGQNAMIGSTVVIDGVEVPYRPVAYGMQGAAAKFHSSVQTNRAIALAFMLLGAFDAAGGPQFWDKELTDPASVHAGWIKAAANESPDRLDLGGTKWFPLGSSGYHMFPTALASPDQYKLPLRPEDMVLLVDFVNPIMTARPIDKVLATWKRFGFVAIVTPHMSATAEYVADVILPCGTLDKWEGPLSARTLQYRGDTVRAPLMAPLGQSKGEMEIYLDLAEKMDRLYGRGNYIDRVNQALSIEERYRPPLDRKPTPEQILDGWSRTKLGIRLDELRRRGLVADRIPAGQRYLSVDQPPFRGVRGQLYVEAFQQIRDEMRNRGVHASLWSHYGPLPAWTQPAMDGSPPEYDLYLIDFKRIEHKQTRTLNNPLLSELFSTNPLVMNAETARRRGLKDEDLVWVESHNPVSGETKRIKTTLATLEGIRPDTVGITHHVSKPDEPSANALLFYGDGFWDMGSGWFSHAKVKVSKA